MILHTVFCLYTVTRSTQRAILMIRFFFKQDISSFMRRRTLYAAINSGFIISYIISQTASLRNDTVKLLAYLPPVRMRAPLSRVSGDFSSRGWNAILELKPPSAELREKYFFIYTICISPRFFLSSLGYIFTELLLLLFHALPLAMFQSFAPDKAVICSRRERQSIPEGGIRIHKKFLEFRFFFR